MTDLEQARKDRATAQAQKDVAIWDALIGAAGQTTIQRYIIAPRIYAFIRTGFRFPADPVKRGGSKLNNHYKSENANMIENFIKFIDGNLSIEEAKAISRSLEKQVTAA